jgi:hypothetical protein
MAEDEEKKQQGEDGAPPPETILEQPKQRDPDEAAFAEQAIHEYAEAALDSFRENAEAALDGVVGWIGGQDSDKLTGGITSRLGDAYLQLMLSACGGRDTPIGTVMFELLSSVVDNAVRAAAEDPTSMVFWLTEGARDFAWSTRDGLQLVLSNQWDQLRDLAYEGSTDFIPVLHALGLPQFDWTGDSLKSGMIAVAQSGLDNQPKTQEEAVEKDPEQEQQEQQQLLAEEDQKAQQAS